MKLLDATFLIDLLNRKPETLKILETQQQLLTTQINMFETIRGLFLKNVSQNKFHQAKETFEHIKVLPLDDRGILKAAEISANLIKKGQMIDDADCLTAGIALAHGIKTIVTKNDKHFQRIKELKVEKY